MPKRAKTSTRPLVVDLAKEDGEDDSYPNKEIEEELAPIVGKQEEFLERELFIRNRGVDIVGGCGHASVWFRVSKKKAGQPK